MAFEIELEVRSYCRSISAVFEHAINAEIWDEHGDRYIDLLAACGALNYGHNHPHVRSRVIEHIERNGIVAAMDLLTSAKREFLAEFRDTILVPRNLDYKVQFTGPTGTNAVEAALKLARKVTKRRGIVAFSHGFHGMTLGALAVTSNSIARAGAGVPLEHVVRLPYDGFAGSGLAHLRAYAAMVESGAGFEPPAAFLLETVQGEGGLNVASEEWLEELGKIAQRLGALLIVDEVQTGCGRTGPFFGFERADLKPDIVCLAKSIGGLGLPLALVLIKPMLDRWLPAEHNGTFRANAIALVAGKAALEFWRDQTFAEQIDGLASHLREWILEVCRDYPGQVTAKGIGLMQGLCFGEADLAQKIVNGAIQRRLVLERCGPHDEVVKIMPPLTIEPALLAEALERLRDAIDEVMVTRLADNRWAAE